jgi:hypothetical protein
MGLKFWIMLFIALGMIGYGFYLSKRDNDLLSSCSTKYNAVVVDTYRIRKRGGYTVEYYYNIKGKKYYDSETINDNQKVFYSLGDTIQIQYSCKDNSVSSIINK